MSAQLKSFCCIEFPGYSDDPRTLIKMCGETKGIERAIKTQSPLVISLRPDVMARPIFGNQLSTGNLVVKLIKKRNKRTGEIKVDYEILGIATRTFRFRALADYQVLVDPQDPIYKLKEDLENWNSRLLS
jgi:general transcription factor 3C polypeptide 5 (transcription factor C subunit 1)